ncbi:hypothetical protein ABPG77_006745 [Micractinium sp. CCAP 211/92]
MAPRAFGQFVARLSAASQGLGGGSAHGRGGEAGAGAGAVADAGGSAGPPAGGPAGSAQRPGGEEAGAACHGGERVRSGIAFAPGSSTSDAAASGE